MVIRRKCPPDENWPADERWRGPPAHRFDSHALLGYLTNAVATCPPVAASQLIDWAKAHGSETGMPGLQAALVDVGTAKSLINREDTHRTLVASLRHGSSGQGRLTPSPLERRLRWITGTFGLSQIDAAILKLIVRGVLSPSLHALADALSHGKPDDEIGLHAMAALLRSSLRVLHERLRPRRPLLQFGLVEGRGGEDYAPSPLVLRLARSRCVDPKRLRGELFQAAPASSLAWDDFAHLGETRAFAGRLVAAALEKREPGIGILLYGDPGTGKTEFARVLARHLEADAVFIGETDECDGEPSRTERISHYAFTSMLAAHAGRTILVVDEADDLFTGVDVDDRASRTGSKVFMNRLVECCAAPTIWITNSPERLGPAVMRRMTLAIRFRTPGRDVRRRVIARLAAHRDVGLAADEIDRLVKVEASPALVDAGLRAAALTGGGVDTALTGTGSLLAAVGAQTAAPSLTGGLPFDPALSSADCDLCALADQAAHAYSRGETALSFCLHGLPGTGKSAYARYLADRLGIEVIEKRASDLLSMYVGGSEQRIAEAFAEAADRQAMLVIDEADSLLRDRAGARQSWEVSQVNEMLTWMERHPQPFVCTTNLMESLDHATMRRFLFKVELTAMSSRQAQEAFRRTFGVDAPDELYFDSLTPGDFAVVARRARVCDNVAPLELADQLRGEVRARKARHTRKIGFLNERR